MPNAQTPADAGLTPTALLQQRTAPIAAQTNGVVTAQVRGEHDAREQKWADNFYLVGPQIGYSYLLFTLQFPLAEFYPARVGFDGWPQRWREVEGEAELNATLDEILADEKTRRVIEAIVARSE